MNTRQVTVEPDISERRSVVLSAVMHVLCQLQWKKREAISEWLSMQGKREGGGVRQSHPHSFTEQSVLARTAESRAGLLPAAAAVCSCKSLTWSRMWQPTPTAEYTLLEHWEHMSSHCREDNETQAVARWEREYALLPQTDNFVSLWLWMHNEDEKET